MKKRVESFLLRMLMLAAVLGAMCFVGAYAEGQLCAQMLLTPACAMIAYGAWQTEKELMQPHAEKLVLQPVPAPSTPSDPDPLRAA